jgi:uncharacterized protein DUF1761
MFGLKPIPVVLATVVFWFLGFIWYGLVFADAWMAGHGIPADQAGGFDIYMAGGVLITLLQVIGLAFVLSWRNVSGINAAVKTVLTMWFLLALPIIMYDYIYVPAHNSTLLMIDGSYVLVGWLASAVILAVMK